MLFDDAIFFLPFFCQLSMITMLMLLLMLC